MRHRVAMGMLLAQLGVLVTGCESRETKDRERHCNEAIRAGRLDVKDGKLDEARQKVALAESQCPSLRMSYVEQLREELRSKEALLQREANVAAEQARKRREQPMMPFMEWLRTRQGVEEATAEPRCYGRDDPRFGWCEVAQAVEGLTYVKRFWQAEPRALRFGVSVASLVVCDDLGEHRVVRRWEVTEVDGATTRRTQCELLSKSHRGFSAFLSATDKQSEVSVFNQRYLAHDKAFAEMLRREGL